MKLDDFVNIMRQVSLELIQTEYLKRKSLLSEQIETDSRVTLERFKSQTKLQNFEVQLRQALKKSQKRPDRHHAQAESQQELPVASVSPDSARCETNNAESAA
jgi:type I site-specific restriction-modification system R (restriction) subunit